jgi:hypothetical protein
MVIADIEEAGIEDLFRKVRADFDAKKVAQSDHQIAARWTNCWRLPRTDKGGIIGCAKF